MFGCCTLLALLSWDECSVLVPYVTLERGLVWARVIARFGSFLSVESRVALLWF